MAGSPFLMAYAVRVPIACWQKWKRGTVTLRKRLKVIVAALTQEWHTKTCAECGGTWMAVGPQTELIAICDNCEINEMERFTKAMNDRYEQEMREAS